MSELASDEPREIEPPEIVRPSPSKSAATANESVAIVSMYSTVD